MNINPVFSMLLGDTNIEELSNTTSLIKQLSSFTEGKTIFLTSTILALLILSLSQSAFAAESNSTEINSLIDEADNLFKQGKYDEAISSFDKILEIEPGNVAAFASKGDTLALLGKSDQAAIMYGKVIEIERDYADSSGKLYLDKLLELDPQNIAALLKKGESQAIYYDRLNDTMSYFNKVLAIEPDNVNASFDMGEAFFQLDKFQEAISWYDKAIEKDPNHPGSLSGKGYALAKLDNFTESDFYFDKALEVAPNNVDVLYKKGSSSIVEQRYDDALSYFYRALKIDPNHSFSQIKIKLVATNFQYKPLDGYAQAILHDSNGNLIANIKVRNLDYLDHKIVQDMIDQWPVIKTINRDGKEYEVHQITETFSAPGRYLWGGSSHFGIYYPNVDVLSLIQVSYWQYQVTQGDTVTLIHTVFRPV